MSESCNSRHFSWLVKSCCPAPDGSQTFSPGPAARSTAATTSISSLPDDLLLDILSRLPLSSLPALSSVCHHWRGLVESPSFLLLRRHRQLLRPTLFALSFSGHGLLSSSLEFLLPSATWQTSSLLPAESDSSPFSVNSNLLALFAHARVAAIGRKIYLLGWNATAELDAWTSSVRFRPPMLFARKKFAAAAVAGKIYLAGGSTRTSEVEVYDPESNQWSIVCDAPRRRYGCVGVGIDGVFYVIGGLKVGATFSIGASRAASFGTESQAYACSMDLYDVEARVWLRSRAVPGGGCVVAACGSYGNLYVLASHAVELSFWRFNARRKTSGGGAFGEWSRMKGPPLPAQVRLDSTVRFGCVGAEDKVVLVQVMGCIDDLLRRSGRTARGFRDGLVLIFDCATEEWNRAADLPEVVARAACAYVEC